MTYTVHSIFKTIQGEGAWTGRVAVFCRFAGCNLWSGREQDRSTAVCKFCDTEFVGGSKFDAAGLADEIQKQWGSGDYSRRMVVLTGGEPALQYDDKLRSALKARGFFIAMETNGSVKLKAPVDWKCVSPKANTKILESVADEIKFVFPQDDLIPDLVTTLVEADYCTIQPMDGPRLRENTAAAIEYVLDNPSWRLGIQAHKVMGLA